MNYETLTGWTEDALIGGVHAPIIINNIEVATDAEIQRGELLCASVAGGTYAPVSAAADAQKILCIAAENFTADSLHAVTQGYFAGTFNRNKIIVGGADSVTADLFEQDLRKQNIILTEAK